MCWNTRRKKNSNADLVHMQYNTVQLHSIWKENTSFEDDCLFSNKVDSAREYSVKGRYILAEKQRSLKEKKTPWTSNMIPP